MLKFITHLTLMAAAIVGSTMAQADTSPYFGRWINSEEKPRYSSKGILYKTIDIAPCGKDFCGVSVSDTGKCGTVLFRFLTIHATASDLTGHGKWGNSKLKVLIQQMADDKNNVNLLIGLGDKTFDFAGREGSMPTYRGDYKRVNAATCTADVNS